MRAGPASSPPWSCSAAPLLTRRIAPGACGSALSRSGGSLLRGWLWIVPGCRASEDRPAPHLAHGVFIAGPKNGTPSAGAEPDPLGDHAAVTAEVGLEQTRAAVRALRQVAEPAAADPVGVTTLGEAPPAAAEDAGVTPESTDNPYQ